MGMVFKEYMCSKCRRKSDDVMLWMYRCPRCKITLCDQHVLNRNMLAFQHGFCECGHKLAAEDRASYQAQPQQSPVRRQSDPQKSSTPSPGDGVIVIAILIFVALFFASAKKNLDAECVRVMDTDRRCIRVEMAWFRTQPSTDAEIIKGLGRGIEVEVTGCENGWARVEYSSGWFSATRKGHIRADLIGVCK